MIANIFFGSKEESRNELIEVLNPYDNSLASKRASCTKEDAIKALDIANKAKDITKKTPLHQRINLIEDVANKLSKNKEDIAQTITKETAKPIAFSRIEVDRCIETLKITASTMLSITGETINTDAMPSGKITQSYYKRVPAGVVIAITPFNFPLNLVAHKLAPALIAGNAVILKPTPEAPLTAYKFVKLFIDSKYATKDMISLIYGDATVGNTLVSSNIPRVVSFTGSVQAGKIIAKNAGIKKIALELGGNAATFIERSSDLKYAANRCAFGAFSNAGQVCISLQRIYVDEAIYDEFANLLAKESKKLVVGSCFDDKTFISALISKDSKKRAKEWINSAIKEGATLLSGGEINGNILTPAILTNVQDDMNIICQEVFAPIVSLVKVKDINEAFTKMNNSPYGLQFSIFTNNLNFASRAIDELDAGGVVINDIPTLRFDIQPYGGIKLSGIGKEGAKWAIEEFTEVKTIIDVPVNHCDS